MLDRLTIHRGGSRRDRLRLHDEIAAIKQDSIRGRRGLAAAFQPGLTVAPRSTGFGQLDLSGSSLVKDARAEAYALLAGRSGEDVRDKGSLLYLLDGSAFGPDSAAVRLAASPEVLTPVIDYLGMLPILFDIEMTRAHARTLLPKSTHMFHLDRADITQMKVFVHLSEVDADCGPFTALPADLSDRVVEALDYRGGRIPDEQVEAIVGAGQAKAFVGPPGFAAFCDTTRCLHLGGRPRAPGKPARDLLMLHYVLPTCFFLPRFAGDGPAPKHLPNLQPGPDEVWNALVGASLA